MQRKEVAWQGVLATKGCPTAEAAGLAVFGKRHPVQSPFYQPWASLAAAQVDQHSLCSRKDDLTIMAASS